jgi:hypothetical protein
MAYSVMAKTKTKNMPIYHIAGWYGSCAIVSGYFLVSFGVFDSNDLAYQVLNLSGASGLFYLGFKKGISESMFLNGFWIIIALISLTRMVLQ